MKKKFHHRRTQMEIFQYKNFQNLVRILKSKNITLSYWEKEKKWVMMHGISHCVVNFIPRKRSIHWRLNKNETVILVFLLPKQSFLIKAICNGVKKIVNINELGNIISKNMKINISPNYPYLNELIPASKVIKKFTELSVKSNQVTKERKTKMNNEIKNESYVDNILNHIAVIEAMVKPYGITLVNFKISNNYKNSAELWLKYNDKLLRFNFTEKKTQLSNPYKGKIQIKTNSYDGIIIYFNDSYHFLDVENINNSKLIKNTNQQYNIEKYGYMIEEKLLRSYLLCNRNMTIVKPTDEKEKIETNVINKIKNMKPRYENNVIGYFSSSSFPEMYYPSLLLLHQHLKQAGLKPVILSTQNKFHIIMSYIDEKYEEHYIYIVSKHSFRPVTKSTSIKNNKYTHTCLLTPTHYYLKKINFKLENDKVSLHERVLFDKNSKYRDNISELVQGKLNFEDQKIVKHVIDKKKENQKDIKPLNEKIINESITTPKEKSKSFFNGIVDEQMQLNFDVISQTCTIVPIELSHEGNTDEKIKKIKIVAYH